ncbi:MAG TPA: 4Fe-4S double cluster binding domain-containing protein, partial [Polyangiaceae bacterium]|nr:4Fe-4S double cluster binding domain-containing protein [Polyangiaceae bacterium]
GTCTSCLDACPTKAFVGPNQVDARRCVSYLTIENHGPIAPELRTGVGRRVFGCDVCQDVCPYNASPAPQGYAPELAPEPQRSRVDLLHWLAQPSGDNRRLVRRSAMRRAGRNQLKRNAAVALGNSGDPRAIPALCAALTSELSPLVRAHVAWALGKLGGPDAERSLESAQTQEADPAVQHELQAALLTLRGRRS